MKSTKVHSLAAALSCMLLMRPGLILADDWATYQHDNAHTGRSSAAFDSTLLTKAWGSMQYTDPIVVGNSVFGIRGNGTVTVTSFNLLNGQTKWSTSLSASTPSYPTYAEGLLVFASSTSTGDRLYVLDAASGAQKYSVDMPPLGGIPLTPTIARNANNDLVAYVAGGEKVAAVNLGANAGSVMWTGSGSIGGSSMATIVGNSIILAGPDQYYAFDQLTGASNHFFGGTISGGGGVTVAFDSARMEFYVHDDSRNVLEAYSYTNNGAISSIWQVANGSSGGSVSIGADGGVYYATVSGLFERDPTDGHVLRSLSGLALSNETTPALSANSIFLYGDATSGGTTEIFDINTFAHVSSISRGRGDLGTDYQGPGAIFDNGYVLYYHTDTTTSGFDVYLAVPEPSAVLLLLTSSIVTVTRRHRKSVPHNRV